MILLNKTYFLLYIIINSFHHILAWIFNEYYNELTHFQQSRFCGYLHSSFIWRNDYTFGFKHEVNQYIWLIPSVNVNYIINTFFVYSFFILHINVTKYKNKYGSPKGVVGL